ncbi:hypothetical protein BKA69DRAFT_59993 [Paraphysoderma sedebokerense]|nr:hypothetical protein BKA69DRAFT_59993 [Paraphysoderma sedebokerense]
MLGPDVTESVSVAEVQPVKKSMAENNPQSPNLASSPEMDAMIAEPTTSVEDTASKDVPLSAETLEESNASPIQAETSQVNTNADPNVVTEVENFVESLIKTVQEGLEVENKDSLIESLVEQVEKIDAPEELEDNKQLAHESNEGPEMENAVTEAESAHSDGVTVDEKPLPEEGNLIEASEPEVLNPAVVDSAIDRADSSVEPVQAVQEGFNAADIANSGINKTQETNLSLPNSLTTQTEEDGVISSPVIESNESSSIETEINSTEPVLPSQSDKSEKIEASTSESTDQQQPAEDEYDMISYQDGAKALTVDTADIPKVADILADSQDEIMVDATVAEEYLLANPSPSIGTDSPVLLDVNPEDSDGLNGDSLEEQNSSKVEDDVIQSSANSEVGIADVAEKDAAVPMEESATDELADQDVQPLETETPVTEPIATEDTLPSYDSVISDYASTGADVSSKGHFEEQDSEETGNAVEEMGVSNDDVALLESQVADLEKELTEEVEKLGSRLLENNTALEAKVADLEKELTEEVEQLETRLLENNTTLEVTVSSSADPTIAVMENESAAEIIEQSDSNMSENVAEPMKFHDISETSVVDPTKDSAVEAGEIAALKSDMGDDLSSALVDKSNAVATLEDQTKALQPNDTQLSDPADVTESSETNAEATVQNPTVEDELLENLETAHSSATELDFSPSLNPATTDAETSVYAEKQEDKNIGMEEQVQVESKPVTEAVPVGSEPLPETQILTDATDNATDDQALADSEPVDKSTVGAHLESSSVVKSNAMEQEEQKLIDVEEQELETAKGSVVVESDASDESYAAEASDILSNEQNDQERAVAEPLETDVEVSKCSVERQVIDEPQSDTVEIQSPSSLVEAVHDSEIVEEMKSNAVADVSENISAPDAEELKQSDESQVAAETDINENEFTTEDRTIAEPAAETETVDSSSAESLAESEDNLQMKDEEILADLREENPRVEPLEGPKLEYVLETPQPLSPFDISRDLPSLAQPVEEFVVVDAEQPDAAVEDEKPIVAVSEKVEEKEIEFETVSDVPEDSAEKTAVTENVAFNEDLADSENNTSPLSDEKDEVSVLNPSNPRNQCATSLSPLIPQSKPSVKIKPLLHQAWPKTSQNLLLNQVSLL